MEVRQSRMLAAAAALALGSGITAADASAVSVDYEYGNAQYTQVNFNADVLVHPGPLTAYVNSVGHTPFYFADAHDSAGAAIAGLHAAHGAAAFEAWKCDPAAGDPSCKNANDAHVPMFSFTMYIQPGWGMTAMDWKLDAWDSQSLGSVEFTAYDLLGNVVNFTGCGPHPSNRDQFALTQGQVEFSLATCGGPISRVDVAVLGGGGLSDVKQVSVDAVQGQLVPEPASLALVAFALSGLALVRRDERS